MMTTHNRLALPPSLYADTAVPPVPAPPLEADSNVSVAIVGGGFAGLSTALHLAEQGTDTIVLEAQEPGWGASGNNGGQSNAALRQCGRPLRAAAPPALRRATATATGS